MRKFAAAIFVYFFLAGCAARQTSVAEIERQAFETDARTNFSPKTPVRLSVAELLKESEGASKEGFSCSLEINLGGRENIQRLRNLWLRGEDDSRYRLVTKEDFGENVGDKFNRCVCPSVCVFQVIDTTKPAPNNFGVVVFSERLKKGYSWVMKDVDLSSSTMTWASSTPHIGRIGQNGEAVIDKNNYIDGCWIRWNSKANEYACAD